MRKKREPPPDEELRTLHIENNSTKVDEYFKKKRSEYVGGWWACLCGILALLKSSFHYGKMTSVTHLVEKGGP